RDQVRRTGVEPLIESRAARVRNGGTAGKTVIRDDGHFMPGRARKRIGEFNHPRSRALAGKDDEFSGMGCALQRRGQKSQNACCCKFSVPCHRFLRSLIEHPVPQSQQAYALWKRMAILLRGSFYRPSLPSPPPLGPCEGAT